ncbi:MAG: exosortase system-associated protein, TIGR04073 family [Candidatus Aureabacteria bacterium]|nr:exosortase system-associated protein, TIGR04073 family [Candidatus Auribacterota bacterium]
MKKAFITMLVLALFLGMSIPASAEPSTNNAGRKLCRGIANVATGWVEIIRQTYEESIASNPLRGLTVGLFKGLVMAVARTGSGAYDIVTFPVPFPNDYDSLVQPEFIL